MMVQIIRYNQQLYSIIINQMQNDKMLTGCPLGCSCEKCLAYGYTQRLLLDNPDMIVYNAPIITRMPVSNFHTMVGMVSLSYKTFHTYPLGDIVKLKATYSDFMPGLSRIYLTVRPDDHKEQITVNQLDAATWFIHIVRAKMYGISNYGIPYRKYEGKIIGKVWIKRFFEGWVLTGVQITDRLRIEKENEIRNIKQFWTRFEIIDVQGLCLVVKFWDFLTKWEIGIPLKELGLWLSAFLSLLKN